jgi:uncharacterized protein (DUF2267 family)
VVCIFCIAVLAIVAGALTAGSIDQIEDQLEEKASDGVQRVSDTESVARFELTVDVSGKKAPVAVTIYKEHGRARIQVLTHDLSPEEVERLEDELAEAIGAKIVDRSSLEAEDHDETAHQEDPEAQRETERVDAKGAEPERRREPGPPPPASR